MPRWAIALAVVLQDTSPDAIRILLEETAFAWHETLPRLERRRRTSPLPFRCSVARLSRTIPLMASSRRRLARTVALA